jgi:hypothetical protein
VNGLAGPRHRDGRERRANQNRHQAETGLDRGLSGKIGAIGFQSCTPAEASMINVRRLMAALDRNLHQGGVPGEK